MKTGCLIQKFKIKSIFKKLTLSIFYSFFLCQISNAEDLLSFEKTSTYLRLGVFSNRNTIEVQKKSNEVVLTISDKTTFETLKKEFTTYSNPNEYFTEINYKEGVSFEIIIALKSSNVEMFNFYREREKKIFIDFWIDSSEKINNQILDKKPLVIDTNKNLPKIKPTIEKKSSKTSKSEEKKLLSNLQPVEETPKETNKIPSDKFGAIDKFVVTSDLTTNYEKSELTKQNESKAIETGKLYRDFRYGATFVWDYQPIIPTVKEIVNLKIKSPDLFYSIQDRDFKKGEKEKHLQLVINLYRKKKWGLMYKAIKLFQEKNGDKTDWEIIEYLKANAIIKENIDNPNPELYKNAILILSNLLEKSQSYELKKSIYKYLIEYQITKNDQLKILQMAKNFYAETRENFDFEESEMPANLIFNTQAKLGLVDKIQELINDKKMKSILPAQLMLAYQSFALIKTEKIENQIEIFEKNKKSLQKPIDAVLLYNTAESYFRKADFTKAKELYLEFVQNYPYEFVAGNAHLRIAICSDFLLESVEKINELYKNAINVSIDKNISYEARIRYVAFRSVRKLELDEKDLESRIFLEGTKNDSTSESEEKNIKKLLQQVRLRTLIVDQKYKEALTYLSLIPLDTMSKIDVRVFEGDGAEIVYGLISDFYKKSEFTEAIKVWQIYKDKYLDKVALDPYINFIIGNCYIKLGLYKGFDEIYKGFTNTLENPSRTYPIWITRDTNEKSQDLLSELELIKDIKLKNWDLVQKNLDKMRDLRPTYNKFNYYKGLVSFQQKNFKDSVHFFEEYFSRNDRRMIFDTNEVADMIQAYTDSIYELKDFNKFIKVSDAIVNDTKNFGIENAYMSNVKERVKYLTLEIMQSKEKDYNFMNLEIKINQFLKDYPQTNYRNRLQLIMAQGYLKNKKVEQGKTILKNLLTTKGVSQYIKELAKSELSLLTLKEKTL